MSTTEFISTIPVEECSLERFREEVWIHGYPIISDPEIILVKNKVLEFWKLQLAITDPDFRKLQLHRMNKHLQVLRTGQYGVYDPSKKSGIIDPKCADAFVEICNLLIPELAELSDKTWDELYDVKPDGKKSKLVKFKLINDLTEILIIFDILRDGNIIDPNTANGRIGQLLEDNFVQNDGSVITKGTVKSMYTAWKVATEQYKSVRQKIEVQIKNFPS